MRFITVFLLLMNMVALANELTYIKLPTLTENLAIPPRLFQCMKNEISTQSKGAVLPKDFIGPFLSLDPATGITDRTQADYYVVEKFPHDFGKNIHLRFLAGPGSSWIYFSYESGGQTGIGVHAEKMEIEASIIPIEENLEIFPLDLTPCAKHLGKGISP